jgi:hypothetical protein
MKDAPFEEKLVAMDSTDSEALAARARLQAVLDKLDVKSGKIAHGDGTGKNDGKSKDKEKKKPDSEKKKPKKTEPDSTQEE